MVEFVMPKVYKCKGFDKYLDGGSICVYFSGTDRDINYNLFFPIDFRTYSQPIERKCYNQPILRIYTSTPYISPVTGISYPDFKEDSVKITWEDAEKLLDEIKPLIKEIKPIFEKFEVDLSIFDAMVIASKNRGKGQDL